MRNSAVFVGCARDCEASLDPVLANIANAARLFERTAFVFIENDSVDATAARLRSFGAGLPRFTLDSIRGQDKLYPMRTVRLAAARNRYLAHIRESGLKEYEYLFVYDMDEANARPHAMADIMRALEFLESGADHAGVFANQIGYYYDMWALRHAGWCPLDPWEEVFEYVFAHRVADKIAFEATYLKRLRAIDAKAPPVEVDSAFGGLGIYRLGYVLDAQYDGVKPKTCVADGRARHLLWQVCEHVSVNTFIRKRGGRLYIAPWLITADFGPIDLSVPFFSPSGFRSLYQLLN